MATDTFDGATGTTLVTHDANWTGDSTSIVLDGSGNAWSNTGSTFRSAYTGGTGSYSSIIQPGYGTPPATDYKSPLCFCQFTSPSSTSCYSMTLSNLSGSNYQTVNVLVNGGFLHTFSSSESIDGTAQITKTLVVTPNGAGNDISVYVNGSQVGTTWNQATATYQTGTPGISFAISGGGQSNTIVGEWTDTATGATAKTASDTLAVLLAESPVSDIYLSTYDSVTINLEDTSTLYIIGLSAKTASDTLAVNLQDTSSVIITGTIFKTASDGLLVNLQDTSSIIESVKVTASDTLATVIQESSSIDITLRVVDYDDITYAYIFDWEYRYAYTRWRG